MQMGRCKMRWLDFGRGRGASSSRYPISHFFCRKWWMLRL